MFLYLITASKGMGKCIHKGEDRKKEGSSLTSSFFRGKMDSPGCFTPTHTNFSV